MVYIDWIEIHHVLNDQSTVSDNEFQMMKLTWFDYTEAQVAKRMSKSVNEIRAIKERLKRRYKKVTGQPLPVEIVN